MEVSAGRSIPHSLSVDSLSNTAQEQLRKEYMAKTTDNNFGKSSHQLMPSPALFNSKEALMKFAPYSVVLPKHILVMDALFSISHTE